MEFNYSYSGNSRIGGTGDNTNMSFSPDLRRSPTFFRGDLRQNVNFREAISALHDVVVSDLRFKPKDKTAYKEWAAQQHEIDWQLVAAQKQKSAAKLKELYTELQELNRRSFDRTAPFYVAQQKYFQHLYKRDYDAWFVLDPVITVHPDEVFFECFSQDESSYGRLSASYEVFQNVNEFECGTTNIDYSEALYGEFQKIRSYKTTQFQVDPSGFEVKTAGESDYKEVKIDLPDSWVRGFLQVSSAMSLPAVTFDLHPMDLYNLCFALRRRKEKKGPRSLRYVLTPGEPVKMILEPWNQEIICSRSPYTGNAPTEIHVWGRRRLLILERLIPVAKSFKVHLLGNGLPSFYVADLNDMAFTLGLSGWTANDWSRAGNFDLMAPRSDVDSVTKQRVFEALKTTWYAKPDELAKSLKLDRSVVLGALSAYTQAGSAIYDLNKNVYRARELSRDPLPLESLRFSNDREASATQFLDGNAVTISTSLMDSKGVLQLEGTVRHSNHTYEPKLKIDGDDRIIQGECNCNWHQQNKLFKGPCEHILALRMKRSQALVNA
jgi:hypothetical protein